MTDQRIPCDTRLARREALRALAGALISASTTSCTMPWRRNGPAFFHTRGVMVPPDLIGPIDWPSKSADAGLTAVCLYHVQSPEPVLDCVGSPRGQDFLARCQELRILVEYAFPVMPTLLPPASFSANPTLFRMNEQGDRSAEGTPCVHSRQALDVAGRNAVALAQRLKPPTHRYFFWLPTRTPWCRCRACAPYSDSDQALILCNSLLESLRTVDTRAELAFLAANRLLETPTQVAPREGLFLEFVPETRRLDLPLSHEDHRPLVEALDRFLALFDVATARIQDRWLQRPPGNPGATLLDDAVLRRDLATYGARGIRAVMSLASAQVVEESTSVKGTPLSRYGASLGQWRQGM